MALNETDDTATEQAANIIQNARSKAKDELDAVDEKIAALVNQAKQVGEKEGLKEAGQIKEKLQKYSSLLEAEIHDEVLRAALDVAAKVLYEQINAHPETVVDVVATALVTVKDEEQVWIRVNPADFSLLAEHKSRLIGVLGRASDIDIRQDKKVEQGGVILHTNSGVIDAQPSTQLEEIFRVFTQEKEVD